MLSFPVWSMLVCWDCDVVLIPWVGVSYVNHLSGLCTSQRCRLLHLNNFPLFCILIMSLPGSVHSSITVAGSHVWFSWRTDTLLPIQESLLPSGCSIVAVFCCCYSSVTGLDYSLDYWCSTTLLTSSLSSNRIGFLLVMANGSQIESFLRLTGLFDSLSLTVLLFPRLFLLSAPYVLWIHLIVGISGLMWCAWIPVL